MTVVAISSHLRPETGGAATAAVSPPTMNVKPLGTPLFGDNFFIR